MTETHVCFSVVSFSGSGHLECHRRKGYYDVAMVDGRSGGGASRACQIVCPDARDNQFEVPGYRHMSR